MRDFQARNPEFLAEKVFIPHPGKAAFSRLLVVRPLEHQAFARKRRLTFKNSTDWGACRSIHTCSTPGRVHRQERRIGRIGGNSHQARVQ
jgi:hypothetical protein